MMHFHPFESYSAHRGKLSRLWVVLLIATLLVLLVQPVFANPPTLAMLDKISKSASQASLVLGETVTYTIHLEVGWNAGVTAKVSDPLPAGLDYVDGSANHGGVYDPATRTLTWTEIGVAAGTPVNLKFEMEFTRAVQQPTPTVNVATIAWNGFVLQRQAWVTLLPEPSSGSGLLGSFKSAEPRLLGGGEQVTYSIHLLNRGPHAATVTVNDLVPAILSYVDGSVSAGGNYDAATRTVSWKDVVVPPYNPLLPVEPITLTFKAQAPDVLPASIRPPVVTNTAVITSGPVSFRRSVDILLVSQPVSPLEGSFKTASQRAVAPGEVFSYSIQLHNSSPRPVRAVVSDPMPAQVSYVDGSANADGVYDETSRTLTWNNLTVAEGSTLELTFDVKAMGPTVAALKIINTAYISSGGITLKRSVPVWLLLNPGGDLRPPVVQKFTIDGQDVLSDNQVRLHISAVDNVGVTRMYLKEWVLATTPRPHWQEVQSSGWIPFQADAPWRLIDQSGTHFMGVWVADAAMNKSRLTLNAIDFASLVLPGAAVAQGGMIPYLVYYPAGVNVSATLTTLTGSAYLFAWYPGNLFGPDHVSLTPNNVQTIHFTTRTAGIYLFLVYGVQAATFDLTITPGGGPRVPVHVTPWPAASAAGLGMDLPADPNLAVEGMTANPILPESGQDPLSTALEPDGPYGIYLPAVQR